ncbi:MAG TPA: DUF1361 domain-containing protein [Chitinophagales bacterium]|nr:DUF1361 domain-containing protein [Chitinophagales bacterium]HNO28183.1 DUF1361 domain-containing protein [Chitinophagales bacterium]
MFKTLRLSRYHYLLCCTAFSMLLLLARMYHTNTLEYRFMAINLFLAWIPYGVAKLMQNIPIGKWRPLIIVLAFVWLIFFPNAPYMITDIFHLSEFDAMPKWYDLIMLLSFSWTGLLLGFFSLRKVLHRINAGNNFPQMIVSFIIFFLCGAGIYLGRYERWNSWEIITQPRILISDFLGLLAQDAVMFQMATLSFVFATFFTMIFYFVPEETT